MNRNKLLITGLLITLLFTGGLTIASAQTNEHRAAKPDDVTISYNKSECQNYQPYLRTSHLGVEPSATYCWIASSPNHDTDAYVYWTYYPAQTGVSTTDSHIDDREPIYVFVDENSGEVTRVVWSQYHWLQASSQDETLPVVNQHPQFRVNKPYHHYTPSKFAKQTPPVKNLNNTFDEWLINGWSESLHPGSATDPWVMQNRESWWRDSARYGVAEEYWEAQQLIDDLLSF